MVSLSSEYSMWCWLWHFVNFPCQIDYSTNRQDKDHLYCIIINDYSSILRYTHDSTTKQNLAIKKWLTPNFYWVCLKEILTILTKFVLSQTPCIWVQVAMDLWSWGFWWWERKSEKWSFPTHRCVKKYLWKNMRELMRAFYDFCRWKEMVSNVRICDVVNGVSEAARSSQL